MDPEAEAVEQQSNFVTVGEAVKQTGMRERTVYRAVKDGRLPSQAAENGVTLVDLPAARAMAAAAAAPPRPVAGAVAAALTSVVAGGGRVADKRYAADGDTAARVFARLQEGATPLQLVEELRLPPEQIRGYAREYRALKAEEGRAPPTPQGPDPLKQLSDRFNALSMTVGSVAEFAGYVNQMDARLTSVEQELGQCYRVQQAQAAEVRRLHVALRQAASAVSLSEAHAARVTNKVEHLEKLVHGLSRVIDFLQATIPVEAKIAAFEMRQAR